VIILYPLNNVVMSYLVYRLFHLDSVYCAPKQVINLKICITVYYYYVYMQSIGCLIVYVYKNTMYTSCHVLA